MNPLPMSLFEAARTMLRHVIVPTPMQTSHSISNMADCTVYLKPECLQRNGSQKVRGAYYMLSQFSVEERRLGVCTFSSGNWGQSVAYAGTRLGIPVTVIMRKDANPKKIAATRGYGGNVILHGYESNELILKAREVSSENGLVLVNPFENSNMMVGLGTLGLEIIEEVEDVEAIVVPIGGGGMIAGISSAVKQIRPDVKIYGVEPQGANAMYRSLKKGAVEEKDKIVTIADGLAVQRPEENTFRIIQDNVDDIVLVSEEEIEAAILLLLERAKLLVEPSGAVPVAAVVNKRVPDLAGRKAALILSGGNIDFQLLRNILSVGT